MNDNKIEASELPTLPEPTVEGSVMHPELKICYRAPLHYTAEQMNDHARAAIAMHRAAAAKPECQYPHETAKCAGCGWEQAAAEPVPTSEAAKAAYVKLTNSAQPTDSGGAIYIATQEMMRAFDAHFAATKPATPAASEAVGDQKHLPGWERGIATVTMNGHQIREALEFLAPDGDADPDQLDNDLTFGVVKHKDDAGKEVTGLCCWNDDTDGVLPLDGEPVAPAASAPAQCYECAGTGKTGPDHDPMEMDCEVCDGKGRLAAPAAPTDAKPENVVHLPRELAQRCLTSMRHAVTFGETGRGRPPQQTCMFEIEELEAILQPVPTAAQSVRDALKSSPQAPTADAAALSPSRAVVQAAHTAFSEALPPMSLTSLGHANVYRALEAAVGEAIKMNAAFAALRPAATSAAALTDAERAFVELVKANPGCKLNHDQAFSADHHPLWRQPEILGFIECIGSYKWRATDNGSGGQNG